MGVDKAGQAQMEPPPLRALWEPPGYSTSSGTPQDPPSPIGPPGTPHFPPGTPPRTLRDSPGSPPKSPRSSPLGQPQDPLGTRKTLSIPWVPFWDAPQGFL